MNNKRNLILNRLKGDTNIVLIGFMGCGKSTIAKRLAKSLNRELADTDAIIEKEQAKSCSQLFAELGEDGFRAIERELLERLAKRKNLIIATGGGFNRLQNLRRMGFVVWLYLSYERTQQRLANDTKRPLWQNGARELFSQRLALYAKECDLKLNALAFSHRALIRLLASFIALDNITPLKIEQLGCNKFVYKSHKAINNPTPCKP